MDPISNMLIMIKNANLAGKASVIFPYSKIKHAIVACLKNEGYVGDISKKTRNNHPVLEVELSYQESKPRITDVERISKSSKRVYFGVKDIQRVRGGAR
jgi:small subunit ribosomal protein S8